MLSFLDREVDAWCSSRKARFGEASPTAQVLIVRSAPHSQPACQRAGTCQRRKRRIREVQRGQLSEPWWLSALPVRRHFEPENGREAQVTAHVWDTGATSDRDGVNENEGREVRERKVGSPAWIRTTIHGSKGRCPTIRRPGNALEADSPHLTAFAPPLPSSFPLATIALQAYTKGGLIRNSGHRPSGCDHPRAATRPASRSWMWPVSGRGFAASAQLEPLRRSSAECVAFVRLCAYRRPPCRRNSSSSAFPFPAC